MRNVLLTALILTWIVPEALAQWEAAGPFPPDDPMTFTMHGVAVDLDGKVWLTPWGATEDLQVTEDSVLTTRALYVFNEDGTPADFSPIQIITIDGVPDTLLNASNGMRLDADGNILHSTGGAENVGRTGWIYRINPQTGEGIDKFQPQEQSQVQPAVDSNGNIYTGNVLTERGPIRIFDSDFNFIENAVDTTVGFSRSMEVTEDGLSIYWPVFTNVSVNKYTRPDEFTPFGDADTLFAGLTVESVTRHPVTGNIWMSSGPSGAGSAVPPYQDYTWYEVDPETDTIVDSLTWDIAAGIASEKPRGIAFTPDGNTAYAVMFDADSGAPSVQKFTFTEPTAIEKLPGEVPESFALGQNYPNPFNPSTTIEFALNQGGHASLKVFDTLGRQVAVLVDEQLGAGSYTATFDAGHLPSGAYVYVLSLGAESRSGTMMLVK